MIIFKAFLIIVFQFFFVIFQISPRFSSLRKIILDFLVLEMFELKGACKHSGNCCRSVVIYDNQQPILSLQHWNKFLKSNGAYDRFKPVIDSNNISYFNCNCLTNNNLCSDYSNRPKMCQNYPTNFFLQTGFLYDTCGYSMKLKEQLSTFLWNKKVKQYISGFTKQGALH